MSQLRAAITGLGIVSALGPDRESFTRGLRQGVSGIRELTLFSPEGYRSRVAGQAPEPVLPGWLGPCHRCSRSDRLALQAAAEAVDDSGLALEELREAAVLMGTGAGGAERTAAYLAQISVAGERKTPAGWLVEHQPANAADLVAMRLGARGRRLNLMTACSSSATALGLGLDLIRLGRARRALVGGAESLCRLTFGGFSALRAMDEEPCRPFHRSRKGLTLGEGAAVLVLEEIGLARARGAKLYAELAGYGVSSDAHHLTAPAPEGRGAAAAMRAALADAGLDPYEVDYINAHGTATPQNDPAEVAAIRAALGPAASRVAVSSTKAMTGHLLGAAGALEAAVCALVIAGGFIPPTLRLDDPDPACDLDLVPLAARSTSVRVALSSSFAFGGHNTTVALRSVV